MGGAITRAMVDNNIVPADGISICDRDTERSGALARQTGCEVRDMREAVDGAEVVVIAVKPQDAAGVLEEISEYTAGRTVVSVMAGVKLGDIRDRLGNAAAVVRAMPNMAASVGLSVTCVTGDGDAGKIRDAERVLSGIGSVMEVEEDLMDSVTALSGSGPAYLFYLAECMEEAGIAEGLEPGQARELTRKTLYGAARLMEVSEASPAELIKRVASKGGTTEAALTVLDAAEVKAVVKEAVAKARKRSEELSRR